MKPLKILFFTDNFPPESNAPANRTYEHCIEWVKKGAEVTVITCNPNLPQGKLYSGHKNKLHQSEMMDGIKVVRVWSYITPNRGTVKRILDYMSFALTSFVISLFYKTDVIVATSPQLFTAVGGYLSALVKRKPWVMEVRDLWPESIKVLDALQNNTILDKLEILVQFLYQKATKIVVVTDRFKERLTQGGVDPDKIHVVKNGVNLTRYQEIAPSESLLAELQLTGKFIVGYVGTHGMAHGLEVIISAAANVKDPSIHFLFIGHGAYKNRMLALKEKLRLQNVTMLDSIPRGEVQNYLSIVDVALIPLRRLDVFKTVIPSKIFESAAMGKPILLGVEGESKEIIESYQAGLCFEPENEQSFIEKLMELKENESVYQASKEGCLLLAKDFDRKKLADKMFSVIEGIVR